MSLLARLGALGACRARQSRARQRWCVDHRL